MQRIQAPFNLARSVQKRTLRPVIAHAEAVPYPGVLHPSFRNADNSFRAPLAADSSPIARSADAFLLNGGLIPGTVLIQSASNSFVVATGANSATIAPAGLLGNFVGGVFDELGDNNEISVWKGAFVSQYEVYSPAFDDTGLAAAYAAATPGNPVKLYAAADGRLSLIGGSPANRVAVATLRERTGPGQIVIDLLV